VSEYGTAVRIGVLGAARIAPLALSNPARPRRGGGCRGGRMRCVTCSSLLPANTVSPGARQFRGTDRRSRCGCCLHHPLNRLHGKWTRAVLAAGKHVLRENPFTVNAFEPAKSPNWQEDRVVMEAFGSSTPEVASAQVKLRDPQGRAMRAQLRFASGHIGRLRCSL